MGRRSRKRGVREPRTPRPPAPVTPAAPRSSRRRREEAPPAPWGSFPLVELCVLLALVLMIGGFFVSGYRGHVMIACGLALGSLGGLEVSIREHFAGYRSHTTVLSGAPAVAVMAVLYFARAPRGAALVAGAVVFATAFWVLRNVFRRRSGGFGFR